MTTRSWVLWGALLSACASSGRDARSADSGQSFDEAVRLLCDVDAHAGITDADDELTVEETRVAWLSERISNPDGIELYTLVRAKPPAEAAQLLTDATREVNLAACPLADTLNAAEP